jgi:hypothetical protein
MNLRQGSPLYKLKLVDRTIDWGAGIARHWALGPTGRANLSRTGRRGGSRPRNRG